MITKWFSNLASEDEKDNFVGAVVGSKPVLDRLLDILKEEEDRLDRSEMDPRVYDLANWEYRQAHKNGFRSCLNLVYKIINIDPKEQNDTGPTVSAGPDFTTTN
jgi:hypothetical protein